MFFALCSSRGAMNFQTVDFVYNIAFIISGFILIGFAILLFRGK